MVSMIATRARNSMFEDRDAYIRCDLRPGVNDCNAGPMRRRRVADVGHWGPAGARWRRHAAGGEHLLHHAWA
jgi:hypothetical protein